jgi:hypothetical protein
MARLFNEVGDAGAMLDLEGIRKLVRAILPPVGVPTVRRSRTRAEPPRGRYVQLSPFHFIPPLRGSQGDRSRGPGRPAIHSALGIAGGSPDSARQLTEHVPPPPLI